MQPRILVILLLCAYCAPIRLLAQSEQGIEIIDNTTTSKYITSVAKKSTDFTSRLDKSTEKYLGKLEKQEAKLRRKLLRIDSLAADDIFANSAKKYNAFRQKAQTKAGKYIPLLDTFTTSLKFLDQYRPAFSNIKQSAAELKDAFSKAKGLEEKFRQTEDVQKFVQERTRLLQEQLKRYGLDKSLHKFNKEAYYYSQQIHEYKEAFTDPDKIERKTIELLGKLPAFQEFMRKNSMLAAMFPAPENYGTAAALQGLQTRTQIQQLLQDRISAGGPNAMAMIQQNLSATHNAMKKLKDKAAQLGRNNGADLDMPDFKPNQQKTKPFLQRLEYGTSIQITKNNGFFPVTSDIALTVAYKLNDKNSIGLGASYKVGWGKDIKHIAITHEGIGIRSFADFKIKGGFYASGGLEYNYQRPFQSLQQISRLNAWQQSGLLGLSKVISLKTKFFKKTRVQLLWDFLSYQQRPVAQPLKFRVGYSF